MPEVVSDEMKYLILLLFFLGLPFWLLQQLVMPALEALEHTYSQADVIAEKVVTQ